MTSFEGSLATTDIPSKSQVSAEANAWPDSKLKANLLNVSQICADKEYGGNTGMDTKQKKN